MGFSSAEKAHYARMAEMIVDGDEAKRQRLDKNAAEALASVKLSMPTADDDMLVVHFASVGIILARLLAAPLQDAATLVESVFNCYTLAAASILGVYKLDDGTVPAPRPAPDDDAARLEELLNRAYL